MPRGDGTGPGGMGPLTGRALGFCAGSGAPGLATPGDGMGRGLGYGRGRGFAGNGRGRRCRFAAATGFPGQMWTGTPAEPGRGFFAPPPVQPMPQEHQLDALKGQAELLEEELAAIQQRIEELSR